MQSKKRHGVVVRTMTSEQENIHLPAGFAEFIVAN